MGLSGPTKGLGSVANKHMLIDAKAKHEITEIIDGTVGGRFLLMYDADRRTVIHAVDVIPITANAGAQPLIDVGTVADPDAVVDSTNVASRPPDATAIGTPFNCPLETTLKLVNNSYQGHDRPVLARNVPLFALVTATALTGTFQVQMTFSHIDRSGK